MADIDFEVSKAITHALEERVKHRDYGYVGLDNSNYETYLNGRGNHFNYKVEKEQLYFNSGVVKALYYLIHAFTKDRDAVAILIPVYYPFFNVVRDTNRHLVEIDLVNE